MAAAGIQAAGERRDEGIVSRLYARRLHIALALFIFLFAFPSGTSTSWARA